MCWVAFCGQVACDETGDKDKLTVTPSCKRKLNNQKQTSPIITLVQIILMNQITIIHRENY
jgi:hypothetical protein